MICPRVFGLTLRSTFYWICGIAHDSNFVPVGFFNIVIAIHRVVCPSLFWSVLLPVGWVVSWILLESCLPSRLRGSLTACLLPWVLCLVPIAIVLILLGWLSTVVLLLVLGT